MASVERKDIEQEAEFMSDFWKFRKKYYIPEKSDEYWEALCSAADDLAVKYGYNPYFNNLINVCVNEIDRRYRKEKRKRK